MNRAWLCRVSLPRDCADDEQFDLDEFLRWSYQRWMPEGASLNEPPTWARRDLGPNEVLFTGVASIEVSA